MNPSASPLSVDQMLDQMQSPDVSIRSWNGLAEHTLTVTGNGIRGQLSNPISVCFYKNYEKLPPSNDLKPSSHLVHYVPQTQSLMPEAVEYVDSSGCAALIHGC